MFRPSQQVDSRSPIQFPWERPNPTIVCPLCDASVRWSLYRDHVKIDHPNLSELHAATETEESDTGSKGMMPAQLHYMPMGTTTKTVLHPTIQTFKCTRVDPSINMPCNIIFSSVFELWQHHDTIHGDFKHKIEWYEQRMGPFQWRRVMELSDM